MPVSRQHQALVEVFRRSPKLVADALRSLGLEVSADNEFTIQDSDLSEAVPAEARADLVLGMGPPRRAVIIEVQRRAPGAARWHAWLGYQALTARRNECETVMLAGVGTEGSVFTSKRSGNASSRASGGACGGSAKSRSAKDSAGSGAIGITAARRAEAVL